MTATRLASASSGSSTLAGVYDITASPYNATTGATDNTTAIQAAITAAKAAGGVVYVPPGVFKYASPLICDQNSKGFSIMGVGGGVGDEAEPPSELRYTGSSSLGISCHSVFSFSLRNLRLTYDNAAFTGDLVDIDGGPHAADCTNWSIVGCGSLKAVAGTFTARSIVRLNKAINGIVQDCGFGGAVNEIREGDAGGSYVVGVRVTNSTFNHSTDAHIFFGTADGENNTVDNCRFEAGTNTTAIRGATVAVDGAGNLQYNMQILGNWFGDAGAATKWIDSVGSQTVGTIQGNYFASSGPANSGTHLKLGNKWLVIGNYFADGVAIDSTAATSLRVTSIGNFYACASVFPTAWVYANQEPLEFVSLHDAGTATGVTTGVSQLGQQVGIHTNANALSTAGPENLLIGGQILGGSVAMPASKAGIYWSAGPGGGFLGPMMALQAPSTGVADQGHVLLWGVTPGTLTPARMVHVQDNKLGLYGATPVVQAARAGQLTDSTGGTVSSTLAAGITDAVAKNAIASLAAKVNALETIIHNLGASA
jgi:hypothetical protein